MVDFDEARKRAEGDKDLLDKLDILERSAGARTALPKITKEAKEQKEAVVGLEQELANIPEFTMEREDNLTPQIEQQQALAERQADITRRKQEAQKGLAEVDLQTTQQELGALTKLDQKQAELKALEVEEANAAQLELTDSLDAIQSKRMELGKQAPKSFWQDADTPSKILMAVSVLVGGLGQGLAGSKSNLAIEAMNRTIDRDLAQKEALLSRKYDLLESKTKDANKRYAIRREKVAAIQAQRQAAVDQTRSIVDRIKLTAKGAAAQSALDMVVADLDESNLALDKETQEQVQALQASKDAPLSTAQANAAGFFMDNNLNVQRAEVIENRLGPAGNARLGEIGRVFERVQLEGSIPILGDVAGIIKNQAGVTLSEEANMVLGSKAGSDYLNGARDFMAAVLRKESGAAISADEWKTTYPQYFAMPGDSASEAAAKKVRRRNFLKTQALEIPGKPKAFFEKGTK